MAYAFNQPLSSLDTSSVKDMKYMFQVRSAACPPGSDPPQLAPSLHTACAAATLPTPSHLPPAPHADPLSHALALPLGSTRGRSTSR
jgi:hypothetical protein